MKINYDITFDDYRESLAAHRRFDPITASTSRQLVWLVVAVFGILAAVSFINIATDQSSQQATGDRVTSALCTLVPWIVIVAVVLWLVRRVFGPAPPDGMRQRTSAFRWVLLALGIVVAMLVGLAVIGISVRQTVVITTPQGTPSVPPQTPSFFRDIVLPVLPWLLIFAIVWFVLFRFIRRQPRRAYDAQPYFHRTQTLEVMDNGVVVSDATARHDLQWSHFTRAVETLNLLLLYIGGLSFYIVPKRAFTSAEDLNEFRRRVQESVADWKSLALPSAFPVVPIAPPDQPPPLPRV